MFHVSSIFKIEQKRLRTLSNYCMDSILERRVQESGYHVTERAQMDQVHNFRAGGIKGIWFMFIFVKSREGNQKTMRDKSPSNKRLCLAKPRTLHHGDLWSADGSRESKVVLQSASKRTFP